MEYPNLGWTDKFSGLIYNNLFGNKNDIENLIGVLIHESSHLFLSSYDINYCKKFGNNSWAFHLSSCQQLLKKHDDSAGELLSEQIELLKIQYLLEGKK